MLEINTYYFKPCYHAKHALVCLLLWFQNLLSVYNFMKELAVTHDYVRVEYYECWILVLFDTPDCQFFFPLTSHLSLYFEKLTQYLYI